MLTARACATKFGACRHVPVCANDRSTISPRRRIALLPTPERRRENVHKRYLIHIAGHNLGILMCHLSGGGTPKEAVIRGRVLLLVLHSENTVAIVLFAIPDADGRGDGGVLNVAVTANPA
jgi:hypothetical protein